MIDFHTHILPNVDDGSKSIEETFKLLKEAADAGFDAVISTSHYMEGYYEETVAKRETWLNAISENLHKKDINLKLYLGSEIYASNNIISLLEDAKASSINNSKYILFEYPMNTKPMNLYGCIYDIQDAECIPVLAHPERYAFIQKNPELVYDLIQKGVLMQSNYGSILGRYGEKAKLIVKKLLENDMVHFLGSDVHRPGSVYPHIKESLEEIELIIGEEKTQEITSINPELAIDNKRIDIDDPKKFKLSLKEKLILRK